MIAATVLKLLFKVKPGIELFREKRLNNEEPVTNKLGYTVKSKIAVLRGMDLEKTADLAKQLDAPLKSGIEVLGYSDFIIKWQNYFDDLPFCVMLHPFRKDLRAEDDATEDQARIEKLDGILHRKVHHADIKEIDDGSFTIDRTLGVASKEGGKLHAEIWTTRETIQSDGTYKMELKDKLFSEPITSDRWTDLPRWFPQR